MGGGAKKGLKEATNNIDDGIKKVGKEIKENIKKTTKTLDELAPNGRIPKNIEFNKWFDELEIEELNLIWNNDKLRKQLEIEIRKPGGLHEWCMVCEVHQFKKWDVSMSEIKRFRTKTIDLVGTNPYDGTPFAHSIKRADGRIVSGPSSKTFHTELQNIIAESISLDDFNNKLQELIIKWKIDPSLLPPLIKK